MPDHEGAMPPLETLLGDKQLGGQAAGLVDRAIYGRVAHARSLARCARGLTRVHPELDVRIDPSSPRWARCVPSSWVTARAAFAARMHARSDEMRRAPSASVARFEIARQGAEAPGPRVVRSWSKRAPTKIEDPALVRPL